MKYSKSFLRKRSLSIRRKKFSTIKKINFHLIFNLIKKYFNKKKIIIAGYYPSNFELDIMNFLKEAYSKKFIISLPVITSSNKMCFRTWPYKEPLQINKFGILEPDKSNKEVLPDLFLVPLVAFDKKLNRIGYGKGYYDRYLKKISKIKKNVISLGIAYSFQKCQKIPTNKHDFKLDYIFTEKGIIKSK